MPGHFCGPRPLGLLCPCEFPLLAVSGLVTLDFNKSLSGPRSCSTSRPGTGTFLSKGPDGTPLQLGGPRCVGHRSAALAPGRERRCAYRLWGIRWPSREEAPWMQTREGPGRPGPRLADRLSLRHPPWPGSPRHAPLRGAGGDRSSARFILGVTRHGRGCRSVKCRCIAVPMALRDPKLCDAACVSRLP